VLEEAFVLGDRQIVSMRIDETSVRPFNDWAIVTGKTHVARQYRGEAAEVMLRFTVCLRQRSVKKAQKVRSLSPPRGAPRRIGAVAP
jgi:ketosteroid isomerase-like protein